MNVVLLHTKDAVDGEEDPVLGQIEEIERNTDQRGPVRTSPLIAEVDGRVKPEAAGIELRVQPVHVLLDERSLYREAELGDPTVEQRPAFTLPVVRWRVHEVGESNSHTRC